jgi:hypothetical protein
LTAVTGTHVRELEALLGLQPNSLHDVRLRAYILRFDQQRFAGSWRRTFRIPAKLVRGYQWKSAGPYDARYRAKASRRRFAIWLACWYAADPVTDRALIDGDLAVIDELRAAILIAADGGAEHAEFWLAGWAP